MLGKKLKSASKSVQANLANAGVNAEESLNHIETVKAFSLEEFLVRRYANSLEKVVDAANTRSLISAFFSSFVSFLINIALIAILCFGIYLVYTTKTLAVGDLTAFILYGLIVALSLALFANSISEITGSLAAIERIKELFDVNFQSEKYNSPKAVGVTIKNADIEFRNVSFSYPDRKDKEVLKDLNFKINYGSHTAIVGQSGSGKSTLIKLILGFYQPNAGQIFFGEVSSDNVHPLVYGSNIAYLPQEPGLFAMSILENLKLAKPEASMDEINEICKKVNIYEFINSLPEGFDTDCGERQGKLSGGQKQRIALARALLKNPDILILDEPSSALDSKNEQQISRTIEELMTGKTVISISHRLTSVTRADQIILLENGEVIATGNHNELFSSNETYKQMTKG
ncbi:UNVERIFIED_CONTAM: hypothetical protein GTU68_061502 [Idotea baltica]|nr:hypothetical protein [Idotea baltica]